jgi:hypothetical protein
MKPSRICKNDRSTSKRANRHCLSPGNGAGQVEQRGGSSGGIPPTAWRADEPALARPVKNRGCLAGIGNFMRRSQSTTAVQLLRETLRQPAVAPYGDRILLRLAEIQGYTQDDWPAARRSLTSQLELYPFSPLTDDSQLKIASSYEMEQNWPQAQTEYQRYLLNYPGADETERIARQQRGMPSSGNVAARDADEAF